MKRGMEPFLVLNRTISSKSVCNYAYIFGIGTPKRFYTLLKKCSSGFYIEPWVPYLANRTFYQKKIPSIYEAVLKPFLLRVYAIMTTQMTILQ